MQVKLGVWAVTEDSEPGEIQWAGGLPDWDAQAPFVAYYKNLKVEDYASWCHGKTGDISYLWNKGWRWEDVKVLGCERRGSGGLMPDEAPPIGSEAPLSTSTATESSDHDTDKVPPTADDLKSSSPTVSQGSQGPSKTGNPSEEDLAVSVKATGLLMAAAPVILNLAF